MNIKERDSIITRDTDGGFIGAEEIRDGYDGI
jgi:hypothetical protein